MDSPKGDKHHFWKGGIKHSSAGYKYILKSDHPFCSRDGYVAEHRLVMEEYLGRYLTKYEHIHHINGDKQDNKIENLQIVGNSEHYTYHQKMRWNEYHKTHEIFNPTLHQRKYRLRQKIFNMFN